jgi:hypothetical protein
MKRKSSVCKDKSFSALPCRLRRSVVVAALCVHSLTSSQAVGYATASEEKHNMDGVDVASSIVSLLSSIPNLNFLRSEQELSSEQQKQYSKRRLIYIPPPPITPFRGGLKTVYNEENQHDPNQASANTSSTGQTQTPTSSSAWTPEQYPDPWTNPLACGGAATAQFRDNAGEVHNQPDLNSASMSQTVPDRDFMHWFDIPALGNDGLMLSEAEQVQFQQKKKLLFCDPDQLLDVDTLKSVASKLQAFAETFASSALSLAEGGNFGSDEEDAAAAALGSSEDSNMASHEGKVTEGRFFALANSFKTVLYGRGNATAAEDMKTRQLRGRGFTHLSIRQDVTRDLGVWEEGSIKEPIEVGIALVKKIDLPAILRADSYFFYSDQGELLDFGCCDGA